MLNTDIYLMPVLLAILITCHLLSGLTIFLSRKIIGPLITSALLFSSLGMFLEFSQWFDLLYVSSVVMFCFISLKYKTHFLNRNFHLLSVIVLLALLSSYLLKNNTAIPVFIPILLAHFVYAILLVVTLIILSRKDQNALVVLAETQSLLADRKQVLEETNKTIAMGNQNLKRISKKVSLILDTASDAFFSMDDHGVILDWNRNAERLFEIKREDAIGNKLNIILIPENYQREIEDEIVKSQSMPQEYVIDKLIEIKAFKPDGTEFPAEMSLSIFRYEGELTFNAFIRDIAQRKKLEQMKDEFLSTVSHELRTPLAIVKGAVSNLKDGILGQLNEKQARTIGICDNNISRLSKLINDLLDLSRLESGKTQLNRAEVNLLHLLKDTKYNLIPSSEESDISYEFDLTEDLPTIYADADMLIQVFTNLLSNAQRYARSKIIIKAFRNVDMVQISITDDGKGIAPEDLPLLFSKFQQINRPKGGSGYKGTGLGLAICKEIVDLHKGSIWAESKIDKGSTFHVNIPIYIS